LIDHGAKSGICGEDILIFEGSVQFVDVSGLAGYNISQLRSVTPQEMTTTYKSEAVATFQKMALLMKDKSILSCLQI
jgi:hypothetical protein